jgi:hypothetical protein
MGNVCRQPPIPVCHQARLAVFRPSAVPSCQYPWLRVAVRSVSLQCAFRYHQLKTYVVFLFGIDLPLVRSKAQCLLLRHLSHLFVMAFVTQGRGRCQEKAASNHDGDEGQAEQEERVFLDGGPVEDGALGLGPEMLLEGLGLECRSPHGRQWVP